MKRVILTILLALSIISTSAFGKSTVDRVIESLVMVTYNSEDGSGNICAGFVIKVPPGVSRVLTASHCTGGLDVNGVDGEDVLVIRRDGFFAILALPEKSKNKAALELRTKPVSLGEKVYALGYGYGMLEVFSRGVSVKKDGDFGMDGALVPGMSGGPVVDLSGKVVGINQASGAVIGIACGAQEIKDFLNQR